MYDTGAYVLLSIRKFGLSKERSVYTKVSEWRSQFSEEHITAANVRFGSKADIFGATAHANVLPEDNHRQDRGAIRRPITVASIVLALPTFRHAPL